jgi:ribosome-binding factor A
MATSRRIQRINKTLMKEISEVVMREVKDPRIISLVSVVEVDMSSDMKNARVVVSIYSQNELNNLKTLEALNSASGFISSMVSKSMRLPCAPHMTFERTHSIELGVNMNVKLKEILDNEGNKQDLS